MTRRASLCLLALALATPGVRGEPIAGSSEEALQQRLAERTAEVDKLKQEGDRLKRDASRLELELAAARAAHSMTPAPTAEPAPTPIRETVFLREPGRPGQTPWPLLLGTALVMLLAGFVLGWKTLDSRIRRKYGGLRIY